MENLTLERRESTDTALNPKNQNQRMPYGMEREKHGETDSKSERKYRSSTHRKGKDGMGEMEREHNTEICPGDIREYTDGILFKHIQNNAVVFRVMQMVQHGELTEIEGLRLMVNKLADENSELNRMCNDLISRLPSRSITKMISGKN